MSAHGFSRLEYYPGFTKEVKAWVIENSRTCCLPLLIAVNDADHSPHLGCLAVLKVPGWQDREVWVSGGGDGAVCPNSKIYRNVCTTRPLFLKRGVFVTLTPIPVSDLLAKGRQLAERLIAEKGEVNTRAWEIDRQIGAELWKILSSLYPHQDEQPVMEFVQKLAVILRISVPIEAVIKALKFC